MQWPPHITVATVVEKNGQFLFVEEATNGAPMINQPAGHLEPEETLVDAAIRETLEESCWKVEITALIGIYIYHAPHNKVIYHRYCFSAAPIEQDKTMVRDTDIRDAYWLTLEQFKDHHCQPRSPLVAKCIADYLNGLRYPLALIHEHG